MKKQIDTLRQLFLVGENSKFEKAAKVILDDKGDSRFNFINNHRERKLDEAYETIYETIYHILTTDESFKPYLSKTDIVALKKIDSEFEKADELADDFYDRAFTTFIDKGSAAKGALDLDETFKKIAEIDKRLKLKNYKTVNKKTSIADKKVAIATMLDEIFIKIKTDVESKYVGKTVPKKVQSSLNAFEKAKDKAIATVSSNKIDEKKINAFTDYVEKLSPSEKEKSEENTENQKKDKVEEPKDKKKKSIFNLIRKPVKGKSDKPVKVNGKKKWIKIGGVVLAVALIAGITKLVNNDGPVQAPQKPGKPYEDEYDGPEQTPGTIIDYPDASETLSENPDYENPDASIMSEVERETYIKNLAHTVYNNWADLGCDYSENDICELIKFLNGYDSSLSTGIADSMLIEMINLASVPATNNIYTGQNATGKGIILASLLVNDQAGIEAVQRMESYLNSMITDPENVKIYATNALTTEIKMVAKDETVDGLNVNTQKDLNSPTVRLLWSRIAIGTNAITGVLGEDFSITVDGETYTQQDINDCEVFENIATQAKMDLVQQNKVLKFNN